MKCAWKCAWKETGLFWEGAQTWWTYLTRVGVWGDHGGWAVWLLVRALSLLVSLPDVVEKDVMYLGRGIFEDEWEPFSCDWDLLTTTHWWIGELRLSLARLYVIGELQQLAMSGLEVFIFLWVASTGGNIEQEVYDPSPSLFWFYLDLLKVCVYSLFRWW